MKPRFSTRFLLVLTAIFAAGLAIPYWKTKTQVLSYGDSYVGYYRGLGFVNGPGYFGKNWYRVIVREDSDGYWEVDVNGFGYSAYRGYYGTGVLREEGELMVEKNGWDILPNRNDLLNAKFFNPSGELISEVKDRTGKQILCRADGRPHWELDLVNGKYAHLKMWHANGQLIHESHYVDGKQEGDAIGFHPNGKVKYTGRYSAGKHVGTWKWYTESGKLEYEKEEGESQL
jgi:MORN repeat variant